MLGLSLQNQSCFLAKVCAPMKLRPLQHRNFNQQYIQHDRRPKRALKRKNASTRNSDESSVESQVDTKAAEQETRSLKHSWSSATVMVNKAISADGVVRELTLAIEDQVHFLDGRKVRGKQEAPRWVDAYTAPGQFVAVRMSSSSGGSSATWTAQASFAISSSPYEAKQKSASVDSSIIQIVADRDGGEDDCFLAELGPGALIEISEVLGRGYTPLFDSREGGLMAEIEEGRPLLAIGVGARGMAPLKAVMTWTPVQAHASNTAVSLVFVSAAQAAAPYLPDWDTWRDAGIRVEPVYASAITGSTESSVGGMKNGNLVKMALEQALFSGKAGLADAVGCKPKDCTVLMSGIPGDVAIGISRLLSEQGIQKERILFCDFF